VLTTALLAVLLPAVIAGIFVVALRRTGAPLGLALGFAAGQIALVGFPGIFPVDVTLRLPHLAILAAAVGAVEVFTRAGVRLRWGLRGALGGLLIVALLPPAIEHRFSGAEVFLWPAGLLVAFLLFSLILDHLSRTTRAANLPLLLVLLISAAAAALTMTYSAMLGQLAGALAAGIGAAGLAALLFPGRSLWPGATAAIATVYSGLLICGHLYSALPVQSALGLWLAPFLSALAGLGPLGRGPAWLRRTLRFALLLIPAGLAVWFAWSSTAATSPAADGY
jgi:hypothetical protein